MIKIITCTRSKDVEEFKQRPIYPSLAPHSWRVVCDCKEGMSATYNKYITEENRDNILVFVHDDVELEDLFLAEKLEASPYDVTGLAGAREFNKTAPSLAWHLAASRESHRGEVAHCGDGKVWTTVFGDTSSRVLTLDGLFLAVKCGALLDRGVTFDENFKWHFYDLAFCMRCYEKGVSCGVLPIRVVHHGLGDSMMSQEWAASQILFREQYC